tara:strand:+ start:909 stop:1181 length:273 start_codon:yes stop_codon:yes gene_type:complete
VGKQCAWIWESPNTYLLAFTKRAENARQRTHVRVVDVPVHAPGHDVADLLSSLVVRDVTCFIEVISSAGKNLHRGADVFGALGEGLVARD